MISKEQLRELCDEINTVALDEKDFNLKILVYMIATELMFGKPAEYRQRLEDTLNFLMPRVKDSSLWPNIELCPVSTLWSLFDMDNRKVFFLVAKVRLGDAPCEIVFRQEMKRNGEYRAMYFIDFLNHRNKTEAFRKQFSKQEILLIRTPLERLRGLRDSFFNASRKTIYEAEANLNSSGFPQLNTLFDTLDEICRKDQNEQRDRSPQRSCKGQRDQETTFHSIYSRYMIPYRPFCLQFMHRNNEGLNFYFADLKKSKVLDIFSEEAKRREQRPEKSLYHYELLLFKEYAESSNFWDVRFFWNRHILVMATTKQELLLMLNNLYKNGFLDDNDIIEKIKVPFRHVDKFALTKDDSGKDDITYEYCGMNCSGGSSWLRPGYYGQRMEIYSPRGHEMIKPDRRVTKHYMMKQLNPLLKDKRICDEF